VNTGQVTLLITKIRILLCANGSSTAKRKQSHEAYGLVEAPPVFKPAGLTDKKIPSLSLFHKFSSLCYLAQVVKKSDSTVDNLNYYCGRLIEAPSAS
jgi:hypothetical protein